MALLRFIALLLVLLTVQLGVVPHLEVAGAAPDLFFLLIVHLSLSMPFHRIYGLQWLAGVAKDLFSGADAGLFATLYLLAGLILSRFKTGFFADHAVTQGAVTLLACGQTQVLAILFLHLRHPHVDFLNLVGRAGVIALYTAVVSPLAFRVFRAVLDDPGKGRRGRGRR